MWENTISHAYILKEVDGLSIEGKKYKWKESITIGFFLSEDEAIKQISKNPIIGFYDKPMPVLCLECTLGLFPKITGSTLYLWNAETQGYDWKKTSGKFSFDRNEF